MPPEEQAQMRAILRRARYGYRLAFHILRLCAEGRTPTEIAACLFCSRSNVYRIVRAYRTGRLGIRVDQDGQLSVAVQTTVLMPWLTRSLGAIRKAASRYNLSQIYQDPEVTAAVEQRAIEEQAQVAA